VILRTLAARGRAHQVRRRAFRGKELVLEFLFPSDRPRRGQPRLPDEIFSTIAQFYWGGGLSAKAGAAYAAKIAAAAAAAAEAAAAEELPEPEESADGY